MAINIKPEYHYYPNELKSKLNFILGKYEDQLGFSTKSIRSFKYLLVAYALIHCLSCGWYVLACPNEASVGNNEFQCYAEGWAIVKEQGLKTVFY